MSRTLFFFHLQQMRTSIFSYIYIYITILWNCVHPAGLDLSFLVGGWATPLKNMNVNWDD